MIKLKNVGKGTIIVRDDSMADLYMMSGDTHEFEEAIADRLMAIHAPNLVKVIDVPLEYQDETEKSEKIVEVEVTGLPVMKEKITKKIKKAVKKIIKKSKK